MKAADALVPARAYDELTDAAVTYVLDHLHPVDCVTCAQRLAGESPAVQFEQTADYVVASLHHPGCQAPAWHHGRAAPEPRPSTIHYFNLWLDTPDGRRHPTLVINPSLELVLASRRDRAVRVIGGELHGFQQLPGLAWGLAWSGPTRGVQLVLDTQVPVAGRRRIWVLAKGIPLWSLDLPASFVQHARGIGHIVLFYSHGFDPAVAITSQLATYADLHKVFSQHAVTAALAVFLDTGAD